MSLVLIDEVLYLFVGHLAESNINAYPTKMYKL